MTDQPTPEAVEAVARQVCHEFCEGCREDSEAILAFIRDAIHRDGPDADAIREALGLGWEPRGPAYRPGLTSTHRERRVVGKWREVLTEREMKESAR